MKFSEIYESPQIIKATDFGLNDPEKNKILATKFLADKQEVIRETDDHVLFTTGTDKQGNVVMIDKKKNYVVYLIEYVSKKSNIFGNTVTQVILWRKTISHTQGITDDVFFGYLLKKYPAIVSDGQQTEDGKRFWINKMIVASKNGYKIGLINNTKKQMDWFDPTTEDITTWLTDREHGWSERSSSKFDRFVIANQ